MSPFYNSPSFTNNHPYELRDGITVFPADRAPCPICGHLTGDCAPKDETGPKMIFGYNTNSTLDTNQTFVVQDDIIEDREIAPGVTMRIVLFKQGKVIPLLKAKELGLI